MQLALRREQQDIKGTFGGHKGVKFVLTPRVVLTPEENQLIDRYKMGDAILYTWMSGTKASPIEHNVTPDGLRQGRTVVMENIGEMINAEEQIKQGCKALKGLLERAAKFGGEEVIEI